MIGAPGARALLVVQPSVLGGEEAVQFCGYPVGLAAVVRGGVPCAAQHYASRVRQTRLRPSSEAVRLGALLDPPSKRTSQESAENRSSGPAAPLTVWASYRTVGMSSRGDIAPSRGALPAVRLMAKSRAAPSGRRGIQRTGEVRSAVALSTVTSAVPGLPAASRRS